MKVNIVDAIMGAGKTQSAINYINENRGDKKFIYITPYITEVERIQKACEFSQPVKYTDKTPKLVDLKNLLSKGKNIVTTHSMFHYFDDEVIDLCYSQDYILIMDEVTDVVEPYHITPTDLQTLLDKYVTVEEGNTLRWRDEMSDTEKFEKEKRLCELGCLALYSNTAMLWMFPVKIFKAFSESYILTYMFNAQPQKYYYDYYGIEYNYLYVTNDFHFTSEPQQYKLRYDYANLINICNNDKLNRIGDDEFALGKSWYERNDDNTLIKKLKDNTYNYFSHILNSASSSNLWTTFTDYKKLLSGKGYTKGFIPMNLRATNDYRDRTNVAYLVNRFFNPIVKNFFVSNGVSVDEDVFALSEMLQFIWRSAVRDGKPINVYIPSRRMRELLSLWIGIQIESSKRMKRT